MRTALWLLIYALAKTAGMLCGWLEEHAEKRIKGTEGKPEESE